MVRLRESLDEIAEVFVEIRFAVAIFVAQSRDLIATKHINLVVDNFKSERLVKSGGETFPGQLGQLVVNACDFPDIAVNRTNVSCAVAGEVHAGKKHERVPGIVIRDGECINGERAGVGRNMTSGFESGEPVLGVRRNELFDVTLRWRFNSIRARL